MKKTLMLTALVMGAAAAQAQTAAPAAPQVETVETTQAVQTAQAQPAQAQPSAADLYAQAQEFAAQADVAYPQSFYDRTLWKASVDSAYGAVQLQPGSREYQVYLAQLYTKTQWWINAYNAWRSIDDLGTIERQWASLSAANLAYLALQRGDRAAASAYVSQGMAWADSASLRAIRSRL